MNVMQIYSNVSAKMPHIDFEITKGNNEVIEFKASLQATKFYDDDILTQVTVYSSGTIHVFFTFDEIARTFGNYDLINDFNAKTSAAKAYICTINGNDYLQLHYSFFSSNDEEDAASNVCFAFSNILDENVWEVLKPLTLITK